MAIYSYKGIDKTGKDVKGNITSESESQAKAKIKSQGIMLVSIKEQKSDSLKKQSTISFGNTISIQDLSLMTRQLATLLKAKIQIVEALNALTDQTENAQLRVVLAEVKQKVNEGTSLAKALSDYPKIFNNVYINMVDAGEASGTLDVVLLRLADFTENQVKLKNKIKGAMIYPVIMVMFGLIMMGIIFVFVIPKITKIFVSMGKELPLQTQICIWISDYLQNYWWATILALFGLYYMFKKYIATEAGQSRWHRFLLKMPMIGELTRMINIGRFCSTLATLLNSGVPILVAMRIVKNLIANVHMAHAVEEARKNIQEGADLASPLMKSGHFPAMVTHMIGLGEKSGELEPMLGIISENYEDQVNTKLNGLTSTLEPLMMIGMGVAVAFIVFSVVVPMMELNSLKK